MTYGTSETHTQAANGTWIPRGVDTMKLYRWSYAALAESEEEARESLEELIAQDGLGPLQSVEEYDGLDEVEEETR